MRSIYAMVFDPLQGVDREIRVYFDFHKHHLPW